MKVNQLIQQSSLGEEEEKDFLAFLAGATEKQLGELEELLRDSPDLLENLYKNYKAKEIALSSMSPEMWDVIIQEEEKELEQLSKQG